MPRNSYDIAHIWEDDRKSTICGLPVEIVVPVHNQHGRAIYQCEDCFHILAGHVKYDPTPAERDFIDAVLGA